MHRLATAVPMRRIQFIEITEPIQKSCTMKMRFELRLATYGALETLGGGVGRRELHNNGCSG